MNWYEVVRINTPTHFFYCGPLRRPSRAVSSPGRVPASAAAAGAADPLAQHRTCLREVLTSESTTGISAIHGAFPALSAF